MLVALGDVGLILVRALVALGDVGLIIVAGPVRVLVGLAAVCLILVAGPNSIARACGIQQGLQRRDRRQLHRLLK